jgi:hypothetical protein
MADVQEEGGCIMDAAQPGRRLPSNHGYCTRSEAVSSVTAQQGGDSIVRVSTAYDGRRLCLTNQPTSNATTQPVNQPFNQSLGLIDGACVFIFELFRPRCLLRFVWSVVGYFEACFSLEAVFCGPWATDAFAVLLCFAALRCLLGGNGEVLVAI